ncbi:MAG: F-type H+-transporting ATPase subunit a [Solirubrobacteraceae bacterium]|jgi:F-type H+-transporting ATPase subunit a|nr:F-type H+-transporting ATPase subunit a [Solirubrobacteraceae bacterium]
MSSRRKLLLSIFGFYVLGIVLLVVIFGFGQKNNSFQIQNEFKLINWVNLGVFSINRAVVYLLVSSILTVVTMVWIARRMHDRPNKVQTAVEALYSLMRDNITRGNMDDTMAARWFPFLGALFLFIWFNNLIGYLPLPTNSEETFNVFGVHIPSFALYAATANISVPLVLALIVFVAFNWEGIRTHGPIGYLKSLIPAGVHGPILILIAPLEVISTFMRLISLTVRLFANILAGHMIILFMAGALAVILGLSFLGWFTLPFGILIYMFELGLVATLQAFIFATLSAIYLGGAVTHH